jgi:hypothetical protein
MIQPPLLGVVNAASAVSARTLTCRAPAVPRSCWMLSGYIAVRQRPVPRLPPLRAERVRSLDPDSRVGAIRAIKRLKAEATDGETTLAAAEIAALWLLLTGNPGDWTVSNIAAGHSGGNSFGARLAAAVAEPLMLNYVQVWHDRPIKGASHPKEFRRLPPLDMLDPPIGATLVIDDVATSGHHMWEALTALRSLCIPAAGVAWISADSATIGRPDWRDGRRNQETKADKSATLQTRAVGQSWRPQQGADRHPQRGAQIHQRGD